ncbi:hypothetical protein I2486_00615 [Cellulophaga sp. E16_2]|uniref:hypothetical protein n=1 Tax=Cellulophaga sp. E16_2 TaxID=2789297 RepID=UPI001A91EF38|nr:hypothetical protein [Cellulophaga sp. E16_2]MBO0589898.1 hypothetical protein [Cellulophaga sp. E16_2]
MKLRTEIEPDIHKAETIFPSVLKSITDYTVFVAKNGDEGNIEYQKVVTYLSELTGKNIEEHDYMIWEYWEGDGEHRESFKIALSEPNVVSDTTLSELTEIIKRIVLIEIPEYLKLDFITRNGFEWELCAYYHQFLKLNFKKYSYGIFNRQKNKDGEWYEPTIEEIVAALWNKK